MAVNHKRIKELLGEREASADNSLRNKAMSRAMGAGTPRTLTPHEWEQWYAQHGIPESHVGGENESKRRWWQFWRPRVEQGS
ncbi:MAG: hypothetical protein HN430_00750 [Halieaceae bacterium]|jgi:hypothetical protein|nr:hypothetical protein [Halieaceae bacterium]